MKVKKDAREQVVHINRICPLLQEDSYIKESQVWSPPLFIHTDSTGDEEVIDNHCPDIPHAPSPVRITCNGRVIHPVDYSGY